jgi:MFS transporter, DHA1 family, tetracycline resistance protein
MSASEKRPAGLSFIFLTLLLDLLGLGLVIPVTPELVRSLAHGAGETAQAYGLLISLFAAMQFLFAPLFGGLSDAYGRRPVLLLSALGTGLSLLCIAAAPSLGWLYAARALSGAVSANLTAANAYIADISTPETRARNFGVVGAAFGLGFVAGPVLGGLLGSVSLRLPFLAAAGISLLSFLYGLLVLPESHPPERRRPLAVRHLNPLGSVSALRRHPGVPAFAVTLTLVALATHFIISTWVLYGAERYGWSTRANGVALAVSGVLTVLAQALVLGPAVRRFGEQRILYAGLLLAALGDVLYGLSAQPWMLFASMLPGVMGSFVMPTAQSLLAARVPPQEQGAVQGAITSLGGLAAIVGPLCATALFAHFTQPGAALRLPGIAFFGASLLLLLALTLAARSLRTPAPAPLPVVATPEVSP